jgi:PKD repeat protein
VSISQPVVMLPPTAAQPYTVTPGGQLTFRGSAEDTDDLNSVEITLRNNTTRENLSSGGTWGTDVVQDWYVISPSNLSGTSYNWSWTTPFNLKPGNYSFQVRATDDLGLSTPSSNRGSLTINAQYPGDAPPDGRLTVTGTQTGGQSLSLNLAGTATDDKGVSAVNLTLYDNDTSKYLQPNGTLGNGWATRSATLGTPGGTSTTFNLPVTLPQGGDWSVTAYAVDNAGQTDTSTSGATARYRIYPGDVAPTLTEGLLSPTENTTFNDGRIFVSGRAEDDRAMQAVQVSIMNSANQYMNSSGVFSSTSPSWRTAFLTSPGTPGSNFSYTSPVVPPGAYTVSIQGIDNHDQATNPPAVRHVNVTHPPGNTAPVAKFTYKCPATGQPAGATNFCEFDGRTSTDENAATLSYAWTYTLGTSNNTGSGPKPTRTFTTPGTYTVKLVVTDEWGIASAPVTQDIVITEPPGNVAPSAVINTPACNGLVCNISGVGSTDPNTGDSIGYLWNFGDGTPQSTSSSSSHTFPGPGNYTVVLTVTDGWGKSTTKERVVSVSSP